MQIVSWIIRVIIAGITSAVAQGILKYLASLGYHPADWVATFLNGAVSSGAVWWFLVALAGSAGIAIAEIWLRWRRHEDTQTAASGSSADEYPDWGIRELFYHIDENCIEDSEDNPSPWLGVGKQVMDKFSTGQLRAWGRVFKENAIIDDDKLGPLKPIDVKYWQDGPSFTYMFFGYEPGETADVEPAIDGGTRYADIKVNKSEAKKIWPEN